MKKWKLMRLFQWRSFYEVNYAEDVPELSLYVRLLALDYWITYDVDMVTALQVKELRY